MSFNTPSGLTARGEMGGLSSEAVAEFRRRIIEWYEEHGDRNLMWRSTRDPWAVLVAALLLRKTSTAQVEKTFPEFMRRFPSPESLLSAGMREVEEVLKPLGMQKVRARLFLRLASELMRKHRGEVPRSRDELESLPGVGSYAASEVLLRAYGKPEPLLDRNVIRVLERVFGVRSSKKRPHTDPELWSLARGMLPEDPEEAEEFSYGVLDLARKVCRARRPKCSECVLKDMCLHYNRLEARGPRS
jgi:A/G-specific adenine glycosylase